MKNTFILLITVLIFNYALAQTPNTHRDMESTDKGILIPRMDSSVRNAIIPNLNEESLLVYDNNLKQFMFWDGSNWSQIGNKEQYVFPVELNVLIGKNSGGSLQSDLVTNEGRFNVLIGNNSGSSLIKASDNTFLGNATAINMKHGSWNTIIGSAAGNNIDTTLALTTVGYLSGRNNKGALNSYFGYLVGLNNTTGFNNTFSGAFSGQTNSFGSHNTFMGMNAGSTNESGSFNTYMGQYSGYENVIGGKNTFLGGSAGRKQEGSYNTMIGFNSGYAKVIGNQNLNYSVFIGQRAGENITESNQLVIESIDQSFPLIRGDFQLNTLDINAFVKIHELLRIKPSSVSYVCTDLLEGTVQYLSNKLQVCTVNNSGSSPVFEWQSLH